MSCRDETGIRHQQRVPCSQRPRQFPDALHTSGALHDAGARLKIKSPKSPGGMFWFKLDIAVRPEPTGIHSTRASGVNASLHPTSYPNALAGNRRSEK